MLRRPAHVEPPVLHVVGGAADADGHLAAPNASAPGVAKGQQGTRPESVSGHKEAKPRHAARPSTVPSREVMLMSPMQATRRRLGAGAVGRGSCRR
jgi:hypothetical protein